MPALQVRDLPQDLYDKLKYRAEREHRSLAQQTIVAIEEHVTREASESGAKPAEEVYPHLRLLNSEDGVEARIKRRKRVFAEIEKLGPATIAEGFPTPEELIREDREAR